MTRSKPSLLLLGAGLAVAVAGAPVNAEVFRSVDDKGAPEFSEHRPPGTPQAQKLKVAAPKAPDQPVSKEPVVHEGTGGMTLRVPPKKDADAKPKPTKEQLAKMKDLCEKAKASAAQLQGENGVRTNRLQYIDKNGERAFLTEDQIQQRITEMKKKIKDYCVK
jgi:hypothetical protein